MHQGSKDLKNVGLGIDLGGTKIAGALFSSEGMVSPKKILYLENKIGQQVGEQILKLIQSFIEWSTKNNMQISTIGVQGLGSQYPRMG
jgi:predicted NBD/HSP70 family sugar kinase